MENETVQREEIAVFKGKNIRRLLHNNEWWFSIIDIVESLTDSPRARIYWADLKRRLADNEGFSELYAKCVQLKLKSSQTFLFVFLGLAMLCPCIARALALINPRIF